MEQIFLTASEEETKQVAYEWAKSRKKGEIILLTGELGAGKTVFSKGIAEALAIKEPVKSPTFTIVREYRGDRPLYHFDLYRISEEDELFEIGFEEYLKQEDAFILIEWPQVAEELLPKTAVEVTITYEKVGERKITILEK